MLNFYERNTLERPSFKEGTVILVDKPMHWTSFNVVGKLRNMICKVEDVKRIKVGHAGTLDPLATGLLIVCTGKYTKKLESFQAQMKQYSGTIALGATRPSYDMETEIDAEYETKHINEELIEEARKTFIGDIMQKPPLFSAIKKGGERLYKKARRGESVTIDARKIQISNFDITNISTLPDVEFMLDCSKGTYVRSLAYDFGRALDSGGYLKSLRREKIGEFNVKDAWSMDKLIEHLEILIKSS